MKTHVACVKSVGVKTLNRMLDQAVPVACAAPEIRQLMRQLRHPYPCNKAALIKDRAQRNGEISLAH